jgi:hypothetical protein
VDQTDAGTTLVAVTVHLVGGQSVRSDLPVDSEILQELFRVLARRTPHDPAAEARLIQLPTEGGHAAFSFSSAALLAVETSPPVLIEGAVSGLGPAPARRAGPRPEPRAAAAVAASPEAHAPEPAPRAEASEDALPRRGPPRVHAPVRERRAAERPRDFDPLPFVQVTDFLMPAEQARLLELTLAAEPGFAPVPGAPSREVAAQLDADLAERIARRLGLLLPHVLPELDPGRRILAEDLELCAQRDGDEVPGESARAATTSPEEITCTYFFHREPRPLSGGELRLRKGENLHLVEPRNNAVMIYPTSALEEMTTLRCPTRAFGDSRFAISVRIT